MLPVYERGPKKGGKACTWIDGDVLLGFDKHATISDISFAFDTHNHVWCVLLLRLPVVSPAMQRLLFVFVPFEGVAEEQPYVS